MTDQILTREEFEARHPDVIPPDPPSLGMPTVPLQSAHHQNVVSAARIVENATKSTTTRQQHQQPTVYFMKNQILSPSEYDQRYPPDVTAIPKVSPVASVVAMPEEGIKTKVVLVQPVRRRCSSVQTTQHQQPQQ